MTPPSGRTGDYEWVDDAAGPVVRPFAVIGGRTRPSRDLAKELDLLAIVETADAGPRRWWEDQPGGRGSSGPACGPEHENILEICGTPLSVAEVAAELDLPVGVVRVLLDDLLDHEMIVVRRPAPVAQFPDAGVLKEVIDGLHAL